MPRVIAEAGARLADFEIYGLVWLDHDLTVDMAYGALVDFVIPGLPITDSIIALVGLERDILALRQEPARLLELPAIAVASSDGKLQRKLNFTIFWLPDEDRPMILAYRANSQTDLELELSRQIRARLMAEAEIVEKSKQLSRANADLESFAAIVSHDLKAPLRHMRYIADDLMLTCGGRAGAEAIDKLRRLQDLSRRMAHMLTELFNYASLGRKLEALAPVDTRAIAHGIVESVPAGGITIAVTGVWPAVTTLAAPLDLVLRNLVHNAVQHHDKSTGHVVLTCRDEPGALVFEIRDDGPGIAPEHHASIFMPFRTLMREATGRAAAASAGMGTGMGLAMVKKTLEAAGGSIAILSDPAVARGTTFIVYWPKLIAV